MVKKMQERQLCPLCKNAGLINYLQSYQINLDEAVVLCQNKLCLYPLDQHCSSTASTTFSRSFDRITSNNVNEAETKTRDAQLALQTKVASHMQKLGHRLQKDAIGIQTGSPQLKKSLKSCLQKREPKKKRGTTPSSERQNGSSQSSSHSIQNGFSYNSSHSHVLQNGSQTFQNFQCCTEKCDNAGAIGDIPWNSCTGSEGNSDKDSLLNSSLDSLESTSTTSSTGSVGDSMKCLNKVSPFAAFQFGQMKPRNAPSSLPNLSSSQHNSHTIETENESTVLKPLVFENDKCMPASCAVPVLKSLSYGDKTKCAKVNASETICENKVPNHLSCRTVEETSNGSTHTAILGSNGASECLLKYPSVFPQWRNKEALCWLDVILCLAVHNETLKTLVFSDSFDRTNLIYRLFAAHNQACHLLQQSQSKTDKPVSESGTSCPVSETKNSSDISNNLVTIARLSAENKNMLSDETGDVSACLDDNTSVDVLNEVREEIWKKLKEKLKCEKGDYESPVFALPLLLQEDEAVDKLFRMSYRFEYECSQCGRVENTEHDNSLPTFPSLVEQFNIGNPQHCKTCSQCGSTKDPRTMIYNTLPECLLMHFTGGLPDISFAELPFGFHGYLYTVTGIVQYVNDPDHFIAWLRNPNDNKWMKCDDLWPTTCRYQSTEPKFPFTQLHIIMWERLQSKPRICRQVVMETDMKSTSEKKNPTRALKRGGIPSNKCLSGNGNHSVEDIRLNSQMKRTAVAAIELPNKNNVRNNQKNILDTTEVSAFVSVRDASSCSTMSSDSSDSVLLPNFISSTPVSKGLIRPVPMPITSVPAVSTMKELSNESDPQIQQSTSLNINQSTNQSGMSSVKGSAGGQDEKCTILKNLHAMIKGRIDSFEDGGRDKSLIKNKNQPCGQKTLIKPSTVFCVPKKSSVEVLCCNGDGNVSDSFESNDKRIEFAHETKLDEIGGYRAASSESEKPLIEARSCDTTESPDIQKEFRSVPEGMNKTVSCKTKMKGEKTVEAKSINIQSERSSSLGHNHRFKVPIRFAKRASLSKDAFFTLATESKNRTGSSSSMPMQNSSPLSPALGGNLTFLNSVKQYLLSRTTGRTEPKFKFQGLNLKSGSNRSSSSNLSELDFPMSSDASSNNADIRSLCNTPSESADTMSVSNCSSGSPPVSSTASLVAELVAKLEQTPSSQPTLKRKLDDQVAFNETAHKRRVDNWGRKINQRDHVSDFENDLNGHDTLIENSTVCNRKKALGGKDMKLVRKLVKNSEKLNTEHVETIHGIHANIMSNSSDKTEKTCETENVLHDLYAALNIPFNSVSATMSDIMTDVDDILNLVNVDDVLPDHQRSGTPLSCFGDSSTGTQKYSDCWIRRPGRNSA